MFRRVVYGIVIVSLVVLGVWYVKRSPPPTYESVRATRETVVHVVSATGHTEPIERIELSFPVGGRLAVRTVEEGDTVYRGAELARLEDSNLSFLEQEAQARALSAQAAYDELVTLQPEAAAAYAGTLAAAQEAVSVAQRGAETAIRRAWVLADGAVHRDVAPLFSESGLAFGITYEYGTTKYTLQSRDYKQELRAGYEEAESALHSIAAVASTTTDRSSLDTVISDLARISSFLNIVAIAVDRYLPTDSEERTVYDTFQASVARARADLSAAQSEVAGAAGTLQNAEAHNRAERAAYELAVAPATTYATRGAAANVKAADFAAAAAAARAADMVLRAPFTGMVSRIDREIGEVVAPYEPVFEILTPGAFDIELYIPEADIAELEPGDHATFTFDAFDRGELFTGSVSRIARTETMREGVPTYKTTIAFDTASSHRTILPGMTADVTITTAERPSVVAVPARSVLVTGGRTYVRIVADDGTFFERDVVTGLRGSDGSVEIVSGVAEGENVILFVEE